MFDTKQITIGTLLFVTIGIGFYYITKEKTQQGPEDEDKKEDKKEE